MDKELTRYLADIDVENAVAETGRAPEVDLHTFFETNEVMAEYKVKVCRWVDSGFRLGGHLPGPEREIFDRWMRGVAATSLDSDRKSSEMRKLMRFISRNNANARSYQAWERRKKKPSSVIDLPPFFIFWPTSIELIRGKPGG